MGLSPAYAWKFKEVHNKDEEAEHENDDTLSCSSLMLLDQETKAENKKGCC